MLSSLQGRYLGPFEDETSSSFLFELCLHLQHATSKFMFIFGESVPKNETAHDGGVEHDVCHGA